MIRTTQRRRSADIAALGALCALLSGCDGKMILTEQTEARRLGASLHVNFVKANEAASRAVMSNADEQSAAAAREAKTAAQDAANDLDRLEPIVRSLGYPDEIELVGQFRVRFSEYRQLDDEVLLLAVENTNLKAQRLAFGSAQESADAAAAALDRITQNVGNSTGSESLKLRVRVGVLEMQVIQARHIAEADDADMTRMEAEMAASERRAREALTALRSLRAGPAPAMADASQALDRFVAVNGELVQLSRRNSNVRSLAVTLGRKRVVAAECESLLRALEETLSAHVFKATR